MDRKEDVERKIIDDYIRKISKHINIERVIFFGSRAKGLGNESSDFDLIIVSRDFNKIKQYKRAPLLYLLWNYPYNIDIICLTPEELKQKMKEIGVIKDAVKNGISIS